jgi:hypothetical protein
MNSVQNTFEKYTPEYINKLYTDPQLKAEMEIYTNLPLDIDINFQNYTSQYMDKVESIKNIYGNIIPFIIYLNFIVYNSDDDSVYNIFIKNIVQDVQKEDIHFIIYYVYLKPDSNCFYDTVKNMIPELHVYKCIVSIKDYENIFDIYEKYFGLLKEDDLYDMIDSFHKKINFFYPDPDTEPVLSPAIQKILNLYCDTLLYLSIKLYFLEGVHTLTKNIQPLTYKLIRIFKGNELAERYEKLYSSIRQIKLLTNEIIKYIPHYSFSQLNNFSKNRPDITIEERKKRITEQYISNKEIISKLGKDVLYLSKINQFFDLSLEEVLAIYWYSGDPDAMEYNKKIRNSGHSYNVNKNVKLLVTLMNRMMTSEPCVVFRGDARMSNTIQPKISGFYSTSFSLRVADTFIKKEGNTCCMQIIYIPKETRSLSLGAMSRFDSEDELLLYSGFLHNIGKLEEIQFTNSNYDYYYYTTDIDEKIPNLNIEEIEYLAVFYYLNSKIKIIDELSITEYLKKYYDSYMMVSKAGIPPNETVAMISRIYQILANKHNLDTEGIFNNLARKIVSIYNEFFSSNTVEL